MEAFSFPIHAMAENVAPLFAAVRRKVFDFKSRPGFSNVNELTNERYRVLYQRLPGVTTKDALGHVMPQHPDLSAQSAKFTESIETALKHLASKGNLVNKEALEECIEYHFSLLWYAKESLLSQLC